MLLLVKSFFSRLGCYLCGRGSFFFCLSCTIFFGSLNVLRGLGFFLSATVDTQRYLARWCIVGMSRADRGYVVFGPCLVGTCIDMGLLFNSTFPF